LQIIEEASSLGCRMKTACYYLNISRRTIQNWEKKGLKDKRKGSVKRVYNKLTVHEENEIINIACSERFIDKTPHLIVPILAQEAIYLASESTFYRIFRKVEMMKDRRDQKPARKAENVEIKAQRTNELWSWDITYLKTCVMGKYYYLYMFMDIWNRFITGWDIHEMESGELAKNIFERIAKEQRVRGVTLHSDNGSPMISSTLRATLERLGVTPSFSRPNVSNDNAYSESLFKTLKSAVGYPRQFNTLDEAKKWVEKFVHWYNYEHLHSGIGYVTPHQRLTGEDVEIFKIRNETYKMAQKAHPERWSSGKLKQWDFKEEVILKKGNYYHKAS
jgi:putative transposase